MKETILLLTIILFLIPNFSYTADAPILNIEGQELKALSNINISEKIKETVDTVIQNSIVDPFNNFIYRKLEWLKYNSIDLIKLACGIVIISAGIRFILFKDKEKSLMLTYNTLMIYAVIRLVWRVSLHV